MSTNHQTKFKSSDNTMWKQKYSELYLKILRDSLAFKEQPTQTDPELDEADAEKGTTESSINEVDISTALEFIKTCTPDDFNTVCTAISQKLPKPVVPMAQPIYVVPTNNYMYTMNPMQFYDQYSYYQ